MLLLATFGIKAYIYEKPTKKYGRVYYQVQFGRLGADLFYKTINFISSSKKERLRKFISRPHHPRSPKELSWVTSVKRVTPVASVELWDLTVEEDHTYVAQGLVTHNTLNFLTVYGGGAGGFSQVAKIPYETAKVMQFNFFKENKGLQKWIKDEALRSKKRGYSKTALGRRRPLSEFYSSPDKGIQAKGDRCAINSCIQGTGADVIKIALYRVWKWIHQDPEREKNIKILMPVHDEIVYEIAESKLADYIPEISRIMKLDDIVEKLGWRVKFEVDAEYGDSFSVDKDFKDFYTNGEYEKFCNSAPKVETGGKDLTGANTTVESSLDLPVIEEDIESEIIDDLPEGGAILEKKEVIKSDPLRTGLEGIGSPNEEEVMNAAALLNPKLKDRVDSRGYFNYTLVNGISQMTSFKVGVIFKMLDMYDGKMFMGPTCKIKLLNKNDEVIFKTKKSFSVDAFVSLCLWNEI